MNKKVSMVMTCYNKANYIGAMLESVLSQTWDNIELILVNDGSTDGSRNVIASYEKRLRERFDLLIIDQENQGRASGLRNGFLRVTGDYVCTPDCDDRLEPDYVLTLAAYLEKNRDVKWVCGDMDCWPLDFSSDTYLYGGEHGFLNRLDNDTWLDAMLSKRVSVTPVTLLARRDCFDKCNFIDNFLTGREYCQEQQIRIPLLANGKGAHINKVLYKYTILAVGSMTEWWRKSADTYYGFLENYRIDAINALKLNNAYSDRRRALFDIGAVKMIANNGIDYDRGKAVESLLENAASAGIFPVSAIRRKTALEAGFAVLHHHLCNHIIRLNGRVKDLRPTGKGRVIAYAAYGMASKAICDGLLNSNIRPAVFWDKNVKPGDNLNGIPIEQPHFESLTDDDVVIMLLKTAAIAKSVTDAICLRCSSTRIYYYYDILDYLADYYFT